MEPTVAEFVGVYHADGGIRGEAKYVVGKLLGRAHCALCDVTHAPLRRKREWDAMVRRRGVPFRLLHLDELPADVAGWVAHAGSPIVLARVRGGGLVVVLSPTELNALEGSVPAFERALDTALVRTVESPGPPDRSEGIMSGPPHQRQPDPGEIRPGRR